VAPVHPGERNGQQRLTLVSSTTFATGVVHLVYRLDTDAPTGDYQTAKASLPQSDSQPDG
jgi:hypothetical protein